MPKFAVRDVVKDPSLARKFQALVGKKKKRKATGALGGSKVAPTATKQELQLNPLSTLIQRDRKRKTAARGRR